MVNGAVAPAPDAAAVPSTTGRASWTPPPGRAGRELTGSAEEVDDTGVPSDAEVVDWSKPEMLDRHG